MSVSFSNYKAASSSKTIKYNDKDEEIQSDEGTIQTLAAFIERDNGILEEVDIPTNPEIEETDYPYLLVHKLSPLAIIPARKTTGTVGLDLAASEDCIIQPQGRGLISTGISMEVPWGTYGRITTRSSLAFRLGLDIGAGVIDCDYRGKIKILAFNHSDQYIHIYGGDCVAQLILEYIAMPEVYEVQSLTPTNRGAEGFGSTTPILQNKSHKKLEARWDTLGEPSGNFPHTASSFSSPNHHATPSSFVDPFRKPLFSPRAQLSASPSFLPSREFPDATSLSSSRQH
ncbi:hypothetical protein ZIOFF_039232 [Zingiber officinale]|uniref:Deoxyuridine 5'-triphosphate nucleotidohydrolase n=1 Tax=Zingiber officinale TaxID=94328 RepID=A0A8J5GAY0_ZINOF|nr:hypothetical protein ZIOFF_039232 [Zingiber officinale]